VGRTASDVTQCSTGKGCVYLKRLDDADPTVLEQLVRTAWQASADTH
jgi:hypothetical protein